MSEKIPSGFKLLHTFRGHHKAITRIAWSPFGKILASASIDNTIRLWNAESGKLLQTLKGHFSWVTNIAWSPDGQTLASSSYDKTIRLWDVESGKLCQTLEGHLEWVVSVAWSPDGQTLASASLDQNIWLWDIESGILRQTLKGHSKPALSIAWSPDGRKLATASMDNNIQLWEAKSGKIIKTLKGHSEFVIIVAWSPDGQTLVSASLDRTIRIWNSDTGLQTSIIEGLTKPATSISFSFDGRLLASKSDDGVQLWRYDIKEMIASLDEKTNFEIWAPSPSLAFHPFSPIIATLGDENTNIRIWELDNETILSVAGAISSVHYTNSKVVVVGDTGVGKSGLSLVLAGKTFVPTISTHNRHVWKFESKEVELDSGLKETRETLLWDMAGQPGYRLIHQLHLNEVALALVVFDGRSETNPFAGVRYWDRALRQAQRLQGETAPRMKKFLIAARIDCGGISVSHKRIDSLINELHFDGYFETSAKEGTNIASLADAIRNGIVWTKLPRISSTELFQIIKEFLIEEKEVKRLLYTLKDLYVAFLKSYNAPADGEGLYEKFETCIKLVESRDLIKRLSFGNLILLQPELLDAYASAIVNEAKKEPDGMGCIAEEDVREGHFCIPENERIEDKDSEKLLLIAAVEDMLHHEIALREPAEDGMHLIFPSQFTREWPETRDPEGKEAIFLFEGPILNIYSTLAVRFSHSGMFKKKEMWRNAVVYTAVVGGECGIFLHEMDEGKGELTLFFSQDASKETRFQFTEYVQMHLQRRALPQTIHKRNTLMCPKCNVPITDRQINMRRELRHDAINCPVCETSIQLFDPNKSLKLIKNPTILQIDSAADAQRERELTLSKIQGKIKINDFDVFLCHNTEDKTAVKEIGKQLKERGILPWLDEWELRPGLPWQQELENHIANIKSAAVFVGENGIGPWQYEEIKAFLREFVKRQCPVIPVLLPDSRTKPKLPIFLNGMTWIDFRKKVKPDPMGQLIWGITGERQLEES